MGLVPKGDGNTDDTGHLMDLARLGGMHRLPAGLIRITEPIPLDLPGTMLVGNGVTSSWDVSGRARTTILKDGTFDAVVCNATGTGLRDIQIDGASGNGGDGVHVNGGRCRLENVVVTNHGGAGARIGGKAAARNCNLWRVTNLVSLNNGSHGLYVHDGSATEVNDTNANVGLLFGLDARGNGGDGLRFGRSLDCRVGGAQALGNAGHGFRADDGSVGHVLDFPYEEANTAGSLICKLGSRRIWVWGARSNIGTDTWVDENDGATGNVLLGATDFGANDTPMLRGLLMQAMLGISNESVSGWWKGWQHGDRSLRVTAMGTGVTPLDVVFEHDNDGEVRLIVGGKRLVFNPDGTVTWTAV